MIWPHSVTELHSFLQALNQVNQSLKFTYDISPNQVHFLDVMIYKDNCGNLETGLYTKPTDPPLYLHFSSFHPKHQKKSIPYSQAIRLAVPLRDSGRSQPTRREPDTERLPKENRENSCQPGLRERQNNPTHTNKQAPGRPAKDYSIHNHPQSVQPTNIENPIYKPTHPNIDRRTAVPQRVQIPSCQQTSPEPKTGTNQDGH